MKVSVCLTIHDREISVLDTVFGSLKDQAHDEMVVVLDRVTPLLAESCRRYWASDPRAKFVEVEGAPGWLCPARAWNVGFRAVTSDSIYCLSSETVQAAGNVDKARQMLMDKPACIFGRAECSCGPEGHEVEWLGTAPGNLLCDAAHPRPLGFIWAAPISNVRAIGGFDEAFMHGWWYDDNDFFSRLWQSGLDFTFTNTISGTHLHHERPVLNTPAGQAGIQRNAAYLQRKHGTMQPPLGTPRLTRFSQDTTHWVHLK